MPSPLPRSLCRLSRGLPLKRLRCFDLLLLLPTVLPLSKNSMSWSVNCCIVIKRQNHQLNVPKVPRRIRELEAFREFVHLIILSRQYTFILPERIIFPSEKWTPSPPQDPDLAKLVQLVGLSLVTTQTIKLKCNCSAVPLRYPAKSVWIWKSDFSLLHVS